MTRYQSLSKRTKRIVTALVVAVLTAFWGIAFLDLNLGRGARYASYDWPFLFAETAPPEDIVLVYLDEVSFQELGQPLDRPLDRRFHALLLDRLREAGARTVVFDIVFNTPQPEQDPLFAEAIEAHGSVVLAGELIRIETEGGLRETLLLAAPELRGAAAGSGLTDVPVDPDGAIRRVRHAIPTPFGERPGLARAAYRLLVPETGEPSVDQQWIPYYGPPGSFTGYGYSSVLDPGRLPADAFAGKVVLVGSRQQAGLADAGKDTFATPYSQLTGELTPGVEIQATLLANLLARRSLEPLSGGVQTLLVVLFAVALAASGCLLAPLAGAPLCLALAVAAGAAGIFLHLESGVLVFWAVPALAQMPLAVALSLGGHYINEYAARWRLRRAFRSYMSEEQARQIDDQAVSLELGGREVEATILFSDLAGFTSMAEGLPPQSVSKALISYFESATEGILDNDGTIIKYVGDAVMATWGAPLKVDREADRAIEAALQMQVASRRPVRLEKGDGVVEQVLETRIGINTGPGLAGNLGSTRRFDYSVIGDTTNLAARLEGMNKMTGSSILVTRAVLDKCADPSAYLTRRVGRFVVKGRRTAVEVFEIYGRSAPEERLRERSPDYLAAFDAGLLHFEARDWDGARVSFETALELHDRLPEDPASRLYLEAIEALAADPPGEDWAGEVVLSSK